MTLEAPNAEQLQRIYSELNMSPEGIKRDVEHLQDWICQQPHLPNVVDERRLEHMLFFCKNSVEKVKRTVDLYYTVRNEVPEFYKNRDPLSPAMKTTRKLVFQYPLPCLTPEGNRIIFFRLLDTNPAMFSSCNTAKQNFMVGDIRLLEDVCLSDIYVCDMRGFTLSHLATYTIPIMRKVMFCAQKVFPIRLKQVHIIYAPPFIDKMMALIRPFLSKKLAQRFYIHSELGNLSGFVPLSALPGDYGGDQPSIKEIQESWKEKLIAYRNFFKTEENIHTDESKRPGKSTCREHLFGAEGSFRTLNVD